MISYVYTCWQLLAHHLVSRREQVFPSKLKLHKMAASPIPRVYIYRVFTTVASLLLLTPAPWCPRRKPGWGRHQPERWWTTVANPPAIKRGSMTKKTWRKEFWYIFDEYYSWGLFQWKHAMIILELTWLLSVRLWNSSNDGQAQSKWEGHDQETEALDAILNAGLSNPTPNGSKGSKGSKAAGMVAGDDPNIPNMLLDWDFTMLGSNGKVTNVWTTTVGS